MTMSAWSIRAAGGKLDIGAYSQLLEVNRINVHTLGFT